MPRTTHAAAGRARRSPGRSLRRATVVMATLALAVAVTGTGGAPAVAAPASATSAPSSRAASGAPEVRYRPIDPRALAGRTAAPARAASGGGRYNVNGYNWGGYVMTAGNAATAPFGGAVAAAADWIEPTVTCSHPDDVFAPWVGLDGDGSPTVEQLGVQTDCFRGAAAYQLWTEMYPAAPVYQSTTTYPVGPGDHMEAGVQYSGGTFYLTMRDITRGWVYLSQATMSGAQRVSAEAIVEAPTGAYPNFGTLNFTSTQLNYGPIGQEPVTALDPSYLGVFQARTNPTDSQGNWSMTYLHE
ncbi:hypothetical protein GCM10023322_78420 [Rugosimonospora acidiphila]|uniref:Peptidase A4 family protein n=1 Tax=Rugosimonospora acidiphila TaxID=556531 RepID=A0ABP9SSU2_9ACTN